MCLYGAKTVCDDGYIDCSALASSRRKPSQSERNETVPLMSKPSATCEDTSIEDLSDGAVATIYQCMSRSFSVGSQLSAAASSTIHEESLSDLTLDAAASHNEYLPMSRISAAKDIRSVARDNVAGDNGSVAKDDRCVAKDNGIAAAVSRHSASRGGSETSPLLSAHRDVDPKPGSVSPRSGLSPSHASDSAMVVPSSMSAVYRNARDESGYLLFRPTGVTPTSDGGSLERLGPPPEVPTSAADYIMPALPPKQRPSSGQRANSLLLSGRPHVAPRRRGSADSWGPASASSGPAVPPRENRDISTPAAGIPSRPASERRATRKPNLTVDAIASANNVYTGE